MYLNREKCMRIAICIIKFLNVDHNIMFEEIEKLMDLKIIEDTSEATIKEIEFLYVFFNKYPYYKAYDLFKQDILDIKESITNEKSSKIKFSCTLIIGCLEELEEEIELIIDTAISEYIHNMAKLYLSGETNKVESIKLNTIISKLIKDSAYVQYSFQQNLKNNYLVNIYGIRENGRQKVYNYVDQFFNENDLEKFMDFVTLSCESLDPEEYKFLTPLITTRLEAIQKIYLRRREKSSEPKKQKIQNDYEYYFNFD